MTVIIDYCNLLEGGNNSFMTNKETDQKITLKIPFNSGRGCISTLGLFRNLDDPCCFFGCFPNFLTEDFLVNGSSELFPPPPPPSLALLLAPGCGAAVPCIGMALCNA